jgi:cell division protein ZapA
MEQKNVLNTLIMNEEYTLSGDQPPEKLALIAEYVDRVMHDIRRSMPAAPSKKIAVLAALNLAEECLRLKEKAETESVFGQKIDQIIGRIDSVS